MTQPSLLGAPRVRRRRHAAGAAPRAGHRRTALQLFTKQANRWAERECEGEECRAYASALAADAGAATVSHDSYLINLASPTRRCARGRSTRSPRSCAAARRSACSTLVSHPGKLHGRARGRAARNADGIAEALERVPSSTILCLETTPAAAPRSARRSRSSPRSSRGSPPRCRRASACASTRAHVYSAGYDLAGDYDGVWARFADALGLDRLRVLHLNDSKTPFASRKDRHELIGEGSLGEAPFRRLMTDERLTAVPKIIETPKGDDATVTDTRMLERLRGYAADG
jgi:deoxyribonuclease-4